ncbi:MAG TPA: hypothetical protein VGV93_09775, partial [Acidimicrobiales bacterium]|nr:hypothetical protein [Acidimicrobiales bacterium]
MDSRSFAFDHRAHAGSVVDHLTEEFDRRLAGPVGTVRSVIDEGRTIGGLVTSGLVSSVEEFVRLADSRSEIEAITPRVDSLADLRSVIDERFTIGGLVSSAEEFDRRLAGPVGTVRSVIDEGRTIGGLADVRSVFDHLTGLDHHRLAGLVPLMEEQVGRITDVDRLAGQLSDASGFRPTIEPAGVPAATLLLILLAFAVTRAGLGDTVLE